VNPTDFRTLILSSRIHESIFNLALWTAPITSHSVPIITPLIWDPDAVPTLWEASVRAAGWPTFTFEAKLHSASRVTAITINRVSVIASESPKVKSVATEFLARWRSEVGATKAPPA